MAPPLSFGRRGTRIRATTQRGVPICSVPPVCGSEIALYGRITDANDQPLANATVSIWQTGADGLYDIQAAGAAIDYRGVFSTNDEPGFQGIEATFNVFDNHIGPSNSKWCCNSADAGSGLWVSAAFPAAHVLGSFVVVSGDDAPERDPDHWAIQGSNDGTAWTTIFEYDHDGISPFSARLQGVLFRAGVDYTMPSAYSYLRYIVWSTVGNNLHQLDELELFEGVHAMVVEPAASWRTAASSSTWT